MDEKKERQYKPLEILGEVSNPDIYKFTPGDVREKRQYRIERCQKDIDKRLKDYSKQTGKTYSLAMNREKVQIAALVRMLEMLGLFTEMDFSEMFWISADEAVRFMEANINDAIKEKTEKEMGRSAGKKIIVPRGAVLNAKNNPFKA